MLVEAACLVRTKVASSASILPVSTFQMHGKKILVDHILSLVL